MYQVETISRDNAIAEIHVGNSHSQVKNLSASAYRKIRKELSFTKTSYFTRGFPQRVYLIDTSGWFPSGLLPHVTQVLTRQSVPFVVHDSRIKPTAHIDFKLTASHAPYPDQEEAVKAAMAAQQGIISMPTGTGKSYVITLLIARLGLKTLVVVPTLELKIQLTRALLDAFNDISQIVVENIDSPRLAKLTDFDVLIIDEAHHAAAKTYRRLNRKAWSGIYHRFFFTATPWRTNKDEKLSLEGIAGTVVYQLSFKTAVSKRYIVPVVAFYIDLPKTRCSGVTYSEVYRQLVVNNVARNKIIAQLLNRLDKSTLCLVREIAHGSNIQLYTTTLFVSGQDATSRRFIAEFNSRQQDKLIGTTGVLGEGVDTKPCEYVIVAGLGKAKSAFLQQVGRAVRTYPGKTTAKAVLFRDASHPFTLRHFNEQRKILKEYYGIAPIKLNIG